LKIHRNVEDVWYPKINRDCVDEENVRRESERKKFSTFPNDGNREEKSPVPEFVRMVGQNPGITEV
jgi:hypothetical protein